jgi:hypothetical protein
VDKQRLTNGKEWLFFIQEKEFKEGGMRDGVGTYTLEAF